MKLTAKKLKEGEGVRLNHQTAENLIAYLSRFPAKAKITIWHEYKTYDCQICCNFEHQAKTKTVNLMTGCVVDHNA